MECGWDLDDLPELAPANLPRNRYFNLPIASLGLSDNTPSSSTSSSQESNGNGSSSNWSMEAHPSSSSGSGSGNSVNLVSLCLDNPEMNLSKGKSTATTTNYHHHHNEDSNDSEYGASSFADGFGSPHDPFWGLLDDKVTDDDWKTILKSAASIAAPTNYHQRASSTKLSDVLAAKKGNKKEESIPLVSVIPRQSEQLMGAEAIFFVQNDESGKPLPEIDLFFALIQYPDGFSHDVSLRLDTSNPIMKRYFFSFVPRLVGRHVISLKFRMSSSMPNGHHEKEVEVAGGPKVIFVSRNYEGIKRDSYNHVRVGFSKPLLIKGWGIAVDRRNKTTYFTDREGHEVIVINSKGIIINRFGRRGSGPGQLWRPTGIAVDEVNNRVVISDKDNHRICIFSMVGQFLFSFGSLGHKDGQFNYPWGVDVSKDGNFIAVADSRNHRVQLFDQNGKFLRKFSVFEVRPFDYKTEFDYPRGIAFDNSGENIYVTDFNVNALFKLNFDLTSKEEVLASNQLLNRPQGVVVDPANNILVCDSKVNLIRVIKPDGSYLCSLDQTGKDLFKTPTDIAVFNDGQVAVVDYDSRFRIF